MKTPILKKYLKNSCYYMSEEKAKEFDNLFESFIMLLKLNRNLKVDFAHHSEFNLTLYARNQDGISEFSFRIDPKIEEINGEKKVSSFQVQIFSEFDISETNFFHKYKHIGLYTLKEKYSEEIMFDVLNNLIKII